MIPSDNLVERVTWSLILLAIVVIFLGTNNFNALCTCISLWSQVEWTYIADLIQKRYNTSETLHFFGTLILTTFWLSCINFYRLFKQVFLETMCLVWVSDISAYFFGGQRLNGTKLFSTISPNKTLGGSVASLISCAILGCFFSQGILFCLCMSIIAQTGDILESYVKRLAGLKDSNLYFFKIPGHGGILDRIDGLILTLPLAFCYSFVMNPLIR
jgi:phosphatidate cytidylyltransferase